MLRRSPALESAQMRRLSLAAVLASTFFLGLTFGIGYPLATLRLQNASVADWMLGLIGAAPSLGILIILPFMATIARRLGAVGAVAVGALGSAASYALLLIVDNAWAWLVFRFLGGVAMALPWLVTQVWVNVASDDATRGRFLALYVMAFSGGMAVCPPLLDTLGVEGSRPIVLASTIGLLICAPLLLVPHAAPLVDGTSSTARDTLKAVAWAPVTMAAMFLCGFIELAQLALLPTAGLAMGLNESTVLWYLTAFLIGALTLQFGVGWLADRLPASRVALAISVCASVLCVSLPTVLPSELIGTISMIALGGLTYGLYTAGLAELGQLKTIPDEAAANAAGIMSYQVGGIAGPAIVGATMTFGSVAGFVGTQALAGAVIAFGIYKVLRSTRPALET